MTKRYTSILAQYCPVNGICYLPGCRWKITGILAGKNTEQTNAVDHWHKRSWIRPACNWEPLVGFTLAVLNEIRWYYNHFSSNFNDSLRALFSSTSTSCENWLRTLTEISAENHSSLSHGRGSFKIKVFVNYHDYTVNSQEVFMKNLKNIFPIYLASIPKNKVSFKS